MRGIFSLDWEKQQLVWAHASLLWWNQTASVCQISLLASPNRHLFVYALVIFQCWIDYKEEHVLGLFINASWEILLELAAVSYVKYLRLRHEFTTVVFPLNFCVLPCLSVLSPIPTENYMRKKVSVRIYLRPHALLFSKHCETCFFENALTK